MLLLNSCMCTYIQGHVSIRNLLHATSLYGKTNQTDRAIANPYELPFSF